MGHQEFQDAFWVRYGLSPLNLPKRCNGCSSKFSLEHAQFCRVGVLFHGWHDEIKHELMNLAAMAIHDSAVQAEPLINPGSLASLQNNSNSNNDIISNKDCGDILIRNFWEKQHDLIVDVRVADTNAPSYQKRDPMKVLESHEKEEKKKYLEPCLNQRRSFTPFVVSSDGLLSREAKLLLKQLSKLLVDKWQKPYSVITGIIRS